MSLITPEKLKKAVSGRQILVDTNIIIYLTDSISPYDSLSRMLFELIEKGDVSAIFSAISVAEVMQCPLKKGLNQNAMDVKNYLMNFPNSICQEINTDVMDIYGTDTRIDWSKLRTVDALIIASGLINNVDLIVSNDRHFQKAIFKKMILSFEI